jgi:diadenosine tetraphosphatase ApaH/serine/threonine PP2A family protein phosphatase
MTKRFTWGALSPNDPSQVPIKYFTREEAEAHANHMDSLIETWEENPRGFWNKGHWKIKPEPWVVKELE